jgi:hypothetical protein
MEQEKREKRAVSETKVLWSYMDSPEFEIKSTNPKADAILELFIRAELSRDQYFHDCPLCQAFFDYEENHCDRCSWPGDRNDMMRCVADGTPYKEFELILEAINDDRAYQYAGKISEPHINNLRKAIAGVNRLVQTL